MFGFGKKEINPAVIGAKQKMLRAKQLGSGGPGTQITSKKEGQGPDVTIPVGIIFAVSCVLALMLSDGLFMKGAGFRLFSDDGWNRVLLGPGYPSVYGDPDINRLLVILIRGGAITAVAGFLPFCTYLCSKISDRTQGNVYVAFWGVSVALPFFYFLFRDFLIPALLTIGGS